MKLIETIPQHVSTTWIEYHISYLNKGWFYDSKWKKWIWEGYLDQVYSY